MSTYEQILRKSVKAGLALPSTIAKCPFIVAALMIIPQIIDGVADKSLAPFRDVSSNLRLRLRINAHSRFRGTNTSKHPVNPLFCGSIEQSLFPLRTCARLPSRSAEITEICLAEAGDMIAPRIEFNQPAAPRALGPPRLVGKVKDNTVRCAGINYADVCTGASDLGFAPAASERVTSRCRAQKRNRSS